jgi:uncharacterized membrane protein
MTQFRNAMEVIGNAVDTTGVMVIVIGALLAALRFLLGKQGAIESPYRYFRQNIGRSILLGLEFLVAGDIIRTVVVAPTFDNVVILGLIVIIRTFLSFSLQLEIEGHFPWQRATTEKSNAE